jgi:TorA maturation chaperone TorD
MEQLNKLAENRSRIYGFLCEFYNGVPREEFVKKLLSEDFLRELKNLATLAEGELREGAELLEQFLRLNSERNIEELTEQLAVEFTRLFRGIKPKYSPPPPYESVYRDEGRVMGASTLQVMNTYLDAGFALNEEYGGPPDYIGTELKFLALASYREAESWGKGDRREAERLLRVQQRFIEEHALAWIPRFCDVILQEAESEFYKGVAKLTRGFLRLDAEQIAETLKLVEEEG